MKSPPLYASPDSQASTAAAFHFEKRYGFITKPEYLYVHESKVVQALIKRQNALLMMFKATTVVSLVALIPLVFIDVLYALFCQCVAFFAAAAFFFIEKTLVSKLVQPVSRWQLDFITKNMEAHYDVKRFVDAFIPEGAVPTEYAMSCVTTITRRIQVEKLNEEWEQKKEAEAAKDRVALENFQRVQAND